MGSAGPYAIGSRHWPGLSKFIEEVGEALQVVGKLLATNGKAQHWDGSDLDQRLSEEIADVQAAVTFVRQINAGRLDEDLIERRVAEKLALFYGWHLDQSTDAVCCVTCTNGREATNEDPCHRCGAIGPYTEVVYNLASALANTANRGLRQGVKRPKDWQLAQRLADAGVTA